jgi:hypothetical protein
MRSLRLRSIRARATLARDHGVGQRSALPSCTHIGGGHTYHDKTDSDGC